MIVTVPVHNEEELLTDCLRGLKGQDGRAAGGMAATLAEWRSALANGNDILVECPDAVVGRLTGKLGEGGAGVDRVPLDEALPALGGKVAALG
jgi:hypothetical protein